MRKKRGIVGKIISFITFMLLCAVILAILPMFDWDIFALAAWVIEKIWGMIIVMADKISQMPLFRKIFS